MTNPARPKLVIHRKKKYKMTTVRQGEDTKNATKLWESGFKSPVHASPQLGAQPLVTASLRRFQSGGRRQSVGTHRSTRAPSAQGFS